jgi:predicted nucleic acid-binding Zn ribbon protein
MPVYTYRREDGTTFDYRQKFLDEPLTVDPETGQHVVRVIQPAGVIFKGSGFYVNDSKSASHSTVGTSKNEKAEKSETAAESKPAAASTETASKPAASPAPAATTTAAAAD